jgi:hypothetical protein
MKFCKSDETHLLFVHAASSVERTYHCAKAHKTFGGKVVVRSMAKILKAVNGKPSGQQ